MNQHELDYVEEEIQHPPHSIEAEQAVLSVILQYPDSIRKVVTQLKPDHFYRIPHQLIYQACLDCHRDQIPIDVVSIPLVLNEKKILSNVGGTSYINDLALKFNENLSTLSENGFKYWVKVLIDKHRRRELQILGHGFLELSCNEEEKAFVDLAQRNVMKWVQSCSMDQTVNTPEAIEEALKAIEDEMFSPTGVVGLSTGFKKLDDITHGWHKGNLIILGARTGTGKTAMALNLAVHLVLNEKKPVLFFSLEMTAPELMKRVILSIADSSTSHEKIKEATQTLREHQHLFLIEDKATMTISDIQNKTQQAMAEHPDLAFVVVDY
ncbi:MAG: AAA family ATPase, partial [Cyanobacteria bacterium]|nr:AAA family ATPase [Cyanobacteriota bacterium]